MHKDDDIDEPDPREAEPGEADSKAAEPDDAEPTRPKRKKKKKRARSAVARGHHLRREPPAERRWTSGQVFVTLVIALGVGAFAGYNLRGDGQAASASTGADAVTSATPLSEQQALGPVASAAPAGADKFGRAPGDEHFGHDHPPAGAPAPGGPAPSGTGPDQFGRAPGSEHYGHNHP